METPKCKFPTWTGICKKEAKEYRSVWTIKGTIEIELNCFENE